METKRRSFLFSNISKAKKIELVKKIKDLGGDVNIGKHFGGATHLICGSLKKTEKFICACITGKWILTPEYVERSHKACMWLEEPGYFFKLCHTDSLKDKLCKAAKRWWTQVNMFHKVAFKGWCVALAVTVEKASSYKRLLMDGEAEILPLKPPFSMCANTQKVTYVFFDEFHHQFAHELQNLGVLCLKETFLADYILEDPEPDPLDYIVTESTVNQSLVQNTAFKCSKVNGQLESSVTNATEAMTKTNAAMDSAGTSTRQNKSCSKSMNKRDRSSFQDTAPSPPKVCKNNPGAFEYLDPNLPSQQLTQPKDDIQSKSSRKGQNQIKKCTVVLENYNNILEKYEGKFKLDPEVDGMSTEQTSHVSCPSRIVERTVKNYPLSVNSYLYGDRTNNDSIATVEKENNPLYEVSTLEDEDDMVEGKEKIPIRNQSPSRRQQSLLGRNHQSSDITPPKKISNLPSSKLKLSPSVHLYGLTPPKNVPSDSERRGLPHSTKKEQQSCSRQLLLKSMATINKKMGKTMAASVSSSPERQILSKELYSSPPRPHSKELELSRSLMSTLVKPLVNHKDNGPGTSSAQSENDHVISIISDDEIQSTEKLKMPDNSNTRQSNNPKSFNNITVNKSMKVSKVKSSNCFPGMVKGKEILSGRLQPRVKLCCLTVSSISDSSRPSGDRNTLSPCVSWPLSFCISPAMPGDMEKPFMSSVVSQCMESSRQNGFYHTAFDHGRPTLVRKPDVVLLKQFVCLLKCEDFTMVKNQAFSDVMAWVEAHPPTTSSMIGVYSDFFDLSTSQMILCEMLEGLTEVTPSKGDVLLLELVVTVIEVNFSFCLQSGNKTRIRECLLVKWLWYHSAAVCLTANTITRLLRVFESVFSAPRSEWSTRAIRSLAILLSLAAECSRLFSANWTTQNSQFFSDDDTTSSFARSIAKIITSPCPKEDPFYVIAHINSFKPAGFRTFITASVMLSSFNTHILSDDIHIGDISLIKIVQQYFFLLPPLSTQESTRLSSFHEEHSGNTDCEICDTVCANTNLTAKQVNKKNAVGESMVHTSAKKGDVDQLKAVLAVPGVDINKKDHNGWTPLHEACWHGQTACVELLLKYTPPHILSPVFKNRESTSTKVDINPSGGEALHTPLHEAVLRNHIEVCKLLLKYGGRNLLQTTTVFGYTALDLALTLKEPKEMVNVLNSYLAGLSCFECESLCNVDFIPSDSKYDAVIYSGNGTRTASFQSCSAFVSLITLLVTSYLDATSVTAQNTYGGSVHGSLFPLQEEEKDCFQKMELHLKMFSKHLRKITTKETFERLQTQLLMLKASTVWRRV